MKTISQVSLEGRRVLIRVDFNVPLDESLKIVDDSRIIAVLPTIKKVINDGGMAIIMSHLGRPENGFEERFSLKHIVKHLSVLLEKPVTFSENCIGGKTASDVAKMNNGDVIVLENLRFYSEEKNGDEGFAKELAALQIFMLMMLLEQFIGIMLQLLLLQNFSQTRNILGNSLVGRSVHWKGR